MRICTCSQLKTTLFTFIIPILSKTAQIALYPKNGFIFSWDVLRAGWENGSKLILLHSSQLLLFSPSLPPHMYSRQALSFVAEKDQWTLQVLSATGHTVSQQLVLPHFPAWFLTLKEELGISTTDLSGHFNYRSFRHGPFANSFSNPIGKMYSSCSCTYQFQVVKEQIPKNRFFLIFRLTINVEFIASHTLNSYTKDY